MAYLKINHDRITDDVAKTLLEVCPFNAMTYIDGKLDIGPACKNCKLCVKRGPKGAIELVEDAALPKINRDEWQGIAVFADFDAGHLHNVTLELLGKAKELAAGIKQEVIALLIGHNTDAAAKRLLRYGADKVYVYDDEALAQFKTDTYADVMSDFIEKTKPSCVLVGATDVGRSLAPRVAARFRTGLTADCTRLEMKENGDLVQIRPAFGGNIMAQIINHNRRPQFCTVRYKVFAAATPSDEPTGEIIKMSPNKKPISKITVDKVDVLNKEIDISEAEVIVAVGRGLKKQDDIEMVKELAELLGAEIACTRPLVENGWIKTVRQIGLSGRTVKAKLIITLGISGSVQFAAGMKNSDCIVAINSDPKASIFDVAHYGIVGDMYEIVPSLISKIKEGRACTEN